MRYNEIGEQLRAYRLESGLRAEEIAARLGVSRAALYRYEKGEVIKLDTVKRLAELLKISPLSLLGIGVEYYSRPIGYFERIRQIEETADQILQIDGPLCYLTTTPGFDRVMAEALGEAASSGEGDGRALRALSEQVNGIMAARKRTYSMRRPGIIAMMPVSAIQRFLSTGIGGGLAASDRLSRLCRQAAAAEMETLATLMETEPIGLQFGLIQGHEPAGTFALLRSRDRASLAINPFRPDGHPAAQTGVAMVTSADEAVATHQRVAEICWRDAMKGAAAAARVRQMIAAVQQGGQAAA
jgi:transcriptional regulator with XRE-family HTH domain